MSYKNAPKNTSFSLRRYLGSDKKEMEKLKTELENIPSEMDHSATFASDEKADFSKSTYNLRYYYKQNEDEMNGPFDSFCK